MSLVSSRARSAAAGLTAIALVGCEVSAPTAPAKVATVPQLAVLDNFSDPFAFDVIDCGVTVAVSGTFHQIDAFTSANSGRASARLHINAKGTGVAQGTGATYQWNDAINLAQQGTIAEGPLTETFTQRTRLIGQGGATDIHFDVVAHVTTNANGDITVQFDNAETACK